MRGLRINLSLFFPRQAQILSHIVDYASPVYAYATLVMHGDRYVAGAAVLGTRLRQLKRYTWTHTYCFVTKDVGIQARILLSKCFDFVVQVPLIQACTLPLITTRQRDLYGSWIGSSFTKWNIFNPKLYAHVPDKVLFLDSDLLPKRNLDELFCLPAPAACFSNWMSERFKKGGIREIYERERALSYGEKVPLDQIEMSLNVNREIRKDRSSFTFAVSGVTVLIEPNLAIFQDMINLLKEHQRSRLPYGFPGVYSGYDEQMLCQLMLRHAHSIHHITPGYIWNAGKEYWVPPDERAVIHFYGDEKPWWIIRERQFADTQEWWDIATPLSKKHPEFLCYIKL